jgi:hypothetical protein
MLDKIGEACGRIFDGCGCNPFIIFLILVLLVLGCGGCL